MNAILYINKTGCQWRMLPSDFAPWYNPQNEMFGQFKMKRSELQNEMLLKKLFLKISTGLRRYYDKTGFGHHPNPVRFVASLPL